MSLISLVMKRRFGPLFATQFLGAFNDNLFKQALVILLVFNAAQVATTESEAGLYTNLAAGLFILPYFLFSTIAGQLADKFDKSKMIRWVKVAEIFLMMLACVGFYTQDPTLLFAILFLMGAQSTFFSPAKYSILPQLLKEDELIAGNGLIEMSTFIAILVGVMAGGFLVVKSTLLVQICVVLVAIAGWLVSRKIPNTSPGCPNLDVKLHPIRQTRKLLKLASANRTIFLSVLGISWLWFYGATILAQMPNFTKFALYGDGNLATALIAFFIVGVGIGSLACIKLSRGEIELGLIPVGSIGMTVFSIDLFMVNYPTTSGLISITQFFGDAWTWAYGRALFDLVMLGAFSSLFVIPLYATVQMRSKDKHRSRIVAANNIYNSIFMVGSSVLCIGLYQMGYDTLDIFLVIGLLNACIAIYIIILIPEFLMRFILWILASTVYRVDFHGRENIPRYAPAVIVSNHISFIDWCFITAACQRPVRFVMEAPMYNKPILKWFFKAAKAIPIAQEKDDPQTKEIAFELIKKSLAEGHLVCIFPEGQISWDGTLSTFRPGVERIAKENNVPIIPITLKGLWGSFFTRKDGPAMRKVPKPRWRKIEVEISRPQPSDISAQDLESMVAANLVS